MQLYLFSHIQPHSPFSSTCEPPGIPLMQRFQSTQQWLSCCEYVSFTVVTRKPLSLTVCVDVFLMETVLKRRDTSETTTVEIV